MKTNYRYLLEYKTKTDDDITEKYKLYKNMSSIARELNIPLYIVHKVIKRCNDRNIKFKCGGHELYKYVSENIDIYVIQPKF
jgi:hypothetical protein